MASSQRQLRAQDTRPLSQKNRPKHIIFISDEIELAETLQMELSQQGYQMSVIHDGLRGLLAVNRMKPDLVVISWSPPRLSALEICERLRANKRSDAIIVLTQEDSPQQRIAGFEAGADDCLSLPLVKEEFIARVNANVVYRDRAQAAEPLLRCAGLLLNRETREVFRGDRFISLTAKEFNLLEYLMEHPFQVLTRTQILESVWGYDYTGSSNIIEVYIRYLRKKLGSTPDNRIIYTVRSVGYILKETDGES
ncbi:MAG: response regulator transcription factor [Cyanobacteria bacterium J06597_16]